jgi:hypothetical protein
MDYRLLTRCDCLKVSKVVFCTLYVPKTLSDNDFI